MRKCSLAHVCAGTLPFEYKGTQVELHPVADRARVHKYTNAQAVANTWPSGTILPRHTLTRQHAHPRTAAPLDTAFGCTFTRAHMRTHVMASKSTCNIVHRRASARGYNGTPKYK